MPVKVKPSEQVKGGGMDGPHIIKEARHEEFDYMDKEGTSQGTGVGLMLRCRNEAGDDREQFYRASSMDRLVPGDDARTLEPATGHDSGHLVDTSTFAIFLRELDNAGFNVEESDINEDVGILDGCIIEFVGQALPKVSGGDRVVPMPAKLLALPDEKNEWRKKFAGAKAGKGSAGSRRSARGSGDDAASASASGGSRRKKKKSSRRGGNSEDAGVDIDALAKEYMTKLLEDYEEIPRDEIAELVLKKAKRDENRKKIIARVFEEDFLTSFPDDWEYAESDEGTMTVYALAEAE